MITAVASGFCRVLGSLERKSINQQIRHGNFEQVFSEVARANLLCCRVSVGITYFNKGSFLGNYVSQMSLFDYNDWLIDDGNSIAIKPEHVESLLVRVTQFAFDVYLLHRIDAILPDFTEHFVLAVNAKGDGWQLRTDDERLLIGTLRDEDFRQLYYKARAAADTPEFQSASIYAVDAAETNFERVFHIKDSLDAAYDLAANVGDTKVLKWYALRNFDSQALADYFKTADRIAVA